MPDAASLPKAVDCTFSIVVWTICLAACTAMANTIPIVWTSSGSREIRDRDARTSSTSGAILDVVVSVTMKMAAGCLSSMRSATTFEPPFVKRTSIGNSQWPHPDPRKSASNSARARRPRPAQTHPQDEFSTSASDGTRTLRWTEPIRASAPSTVLRFRPIAVAGSHWWTSVSP